MKTRKADLIVNQIVNMDSTEASIVEKYQEVRRPLSSLKFGDAPVVDLLR